MKKALLFFGLMLVGMQTFSQGDKGSRPSPPAVAKATVDGKTITVDYSQPSVKGRKIWGGLVPYGEVWRTGANETTTIEFSDHVMLQGKTVPKGKYALFTIPGEKEWTIIINKGIKWGAFSYKQDEDVLRVAVPSKKSGEFHEKMLIKASSNGLISILWENLQVDFTVK
ncbi:hypothetical protein DYBT9275_05696 [Dyadobacter sp. CECT 9275]|uniref:DUF2911 domain-containing protein n=1 Tax=Dyadobacter helix TaxID=2822344 RepID=A0A916JHC2_9BACT|nr:DUF2911 domain-containing protein [Dyadobacter sp. CECT 9275]CAG5017078.1 hypothetical protein DYBT9275_05696 [Dyadobacter sp. CECT 9275]